MIMVYKNTNTMVRSPDNNIDFFIILAGVLQDDILARNAFIIYQDLTLQTWINLMK